ncbi:MAG: phosphoribosyltransferase [Proteobacteria bacterium]|nr:phosphoribosyltransferase [Pseudomonadota bacterium]
MHQCFRDRQAAGRALGAEVSRRLGPFSVPPLVLGLPRGGVPVAAEVARAVGGELDVLVVRKVGVPGDPELAMGAVGPGGIEVRNAELLQSLPAAAAAFGAAAAAEAAEVTRRERMFRGARPALRLAGRDVVLVDDGVATGATLRAAIRAARGLKAGSLTVAVPVATRATAAQLGREVDAFVCLATPAELHAVGEWYRDFRPVEDEAVCAVLGATESAAAARA